MKKIIRIPLVLIILLVLIPIVCIKCNASTTGVITEITVNVREKASLDSDIVMFVTQDDKVEIIEKTGDWYKIKYNNTEGYVYSDFVKVEEDVKTTANNEDTNKNLETEDEELTTTIETKLSLSNNTGVKIAPNVISNVIYTTTSDENIDLLEQINGWSYISVNNIRGWVRNEQIKEVTENEDITVEENKEEEKTTSKNEIAYVKYDNVNLRKEPSTDSSVIEKLKLNTEVTIIETVDSTWNKVTVDGNTGYISKDLLSSEKQAETKNETSETNTTSRDGETTQREKTQSNSSSSKQEETKNEENTNVTTSSKGQEIVAYAKKYLGYKYVYGGSSPETGFDCSGFTSYVYKHFGYNISRSSVGQASDGTKVSKSELQPGDLVIYKNTSLTKIGHVGIYIGDNKMIHASEPGVGVIITDIDSKSHNYPKRFVMGRRIIK